MLRRFPKPRGEEVKRAYPGAVALISLLWGCDTGTLEDRLVLTFAPYSTPVNVDTDCGNGGCGGQERIAATLGFDRDSYVAEDTRVQFEQYRVEYDLPDIEPDVPYFASPLDLVVTPAETTTFYFYAAGQTQRDFVREAAGGEPAQGTARLTLAGYDDQDEQVFLEKGFDISFADFRASAEAAGGSDGSTER
jgi:hypothetical protein